MKGLLPVEAEQNNTCYADHKSHKKSHLQFLIPQEKKSQNGGAERCCRHDHPHIGRISIGQRNILHKEIQGDTADSRSHEQKLMASLFDSQPFVIHQTKRRKTDKEPEKQNLLEQIQQMAGLDLLMLVLPEGQEVSKGVIQTRGLPSAMHTEDILKDNFLERILTDEYIGRFFTCFLSADQKEVRYEQEYVLGGKSTDEENLKFAAAKILAVREGLNLIHILSDSQKREEARALAAAITGITGTAPLTGIVAFFVMTVWALGEAAADLKALLAGDRVPLIKTRETWKLNLDGLLTLGEQGKVEAGQETGEGKRYENYLKMLLFIEPAERLYYRVMDVVQINLSRKQPDFTMERCVYQAEIVGTGTGKHLFWLGGDPRYTMEVHTDKAY